VRAGEVSVLTGLMRYGSGLPVNGPSKPYGVCWPRSVPALPPSGRLHRTSATNGPRCPAARGSPATHRTETSLSRQ
jgi:hypothetical protein